MDRVTFAALAATLVALLAADLTGLPATVSAVGTAGVVVVLSLALLRSTSRRPMRRGVRKLAGVGVGAGALAAAIALLAAALDATAAIPDAAFTAALVAAMSAWAAAALHELTGAARQDGLRASLGLAETRQRDGRAAT